MYLYIFFIYSFIGWLYESTICSFVTEHKFINRGFLYGPICPIYGIGAVLNWILFADVDNIFALFFASALVSGTIEYLVSLCLEELFEARWWDYSNFKFNLNGRVCLYGIILFGLSNTVMILFFTPNFLRYYYSYTLIFDSLANFLFKALLIDLFIALNNWCRLTQRLKKLKAELKNKPFNLFNISNRELRILKAFPKLELLNQENNFLLNKIKKIL